MKYPRFTMSDKARRSDQTYLWKNWSHHWNEEAVKVFNAELRKQQRIEKLELANRRMKEELAGTTVIKSKKEVAMKQVAVDQLSSAPAQTPTRQYLYTVKVRGQTDPVQALGHDIYDVARFLGQKPENVTYQHKTRFTQAMSDPTPRTKARPKEGKMSKVEQIKALREKQLEIAKNTKTLATGKQAEEKEWNDMTPAEKVAAVKSSVKAEAKREFAKPEKPAKKHPLDKLLQKTFSPLTKAEKKPAKKKLDTRFVPEIEQPAKPVKVKVAPIPKPKSAPKKPEPAKSKPVEKKAAPGLAPVKNGKTADAPGRRIIAVFGTFPVTNVLAWMGVKGFSHAQATAALASTKLDPMPTKLCVTTYLYRGKKGEKEPAALSKDQQKKLLAFLKD